MAGCYTAAKSEVTMSLRGNERAVEKWSEKSGQVKMQANKGAEMRFLETVCQSKSKAGSQATSTATVSGNDERLRGYCFYASATVSVANLHSVHEPEYVFIFFANFFDVLLL